MRAEPKQFYSGELHTVTYEDGTTWVECQLIGPPSMAGRSVELYLSPEVGRKLLLDLRAAGIRARSQTMTKDDET